MKNKTIVIFTLTFLLTFSIVYAIGDTNLSNNNMFITVDVVNTRTLNLTFVRIDNANDFDQIVQESLNFINETFPVATDSITHGSNIVYQTSTAEKNDPDKLNHNLKTFSIISANIGQTIGILPGGWFASNSGSNSLGEAIFFPGKLSNPSAVLVESVGHKGIAAHELGHTIGGFCEEYDSGDWSYQDNLSSFSYPFFAKCPNGDDPDLAGRQLDMDCIPQGCPVTIPNIVSPEVSSQSSVPLERTLYNFMGSGSQDSAWISKESYEYLMDNLRPSLFTSFETFLIGGFINKSSDTIELFPGYELETRDIVVSNLTSVGNYTIETFDKDNNTIFHMNFTPSFLEGSFNGSVVEGNTSYFLFVINNTVNNTRIELKSNGVLKESIDRTNNAPSINITYPAGQEELFGPFSITWSAADADADNLSYAILVSSNNGSDYTTLEVDYNQTSYEVDPNDFTYSGQYLFKVLVTDGINTNNDMGISI
ncbi:MAG: hypothetical protein Q8R47_02180 [Nanoarchaeota archaeon]|nr:hypothetical protein [Nanoarchaeota archaeon]